MTVTPSPQSVVVPVALLAPIVTMWREASCHDLAPADDKHAWGFNRADIYWGDIRKLAEAAAPAPSSLAGGEVFDLVAHLHRQRAFSERTFGPGARTVGVVDHIRKELREIEADPSDVTEWIDVVLLALDGAWRAGFAPEDVATAINAKQTKNEGRTWPDWRTADPDKAIEHDRSGEAALSPEAPAQEGVSLEEIEKALASAPLFMGAVARGHVVMSDVSRHVFAALTPRHEAPAEPVSASQIERIIQDEVSMCQCGCDCLQGQDIAADRILALTDAKHEAPAEGAGESLSERLRFAETWDLDADQEARDRCGVLMLEAAEALERARSSAPEAREGEFVLVPREPTGAMLKAAFVAMNDTPSGTWKRMKAEARHPIQIFNAKMRPRWAAMISAAPSADKLREVVEALENVTMWLASLGPFKGGAAEALSDAEEALAALKAEGGK